MDIDLLKSTPDDQIDMMLMMHMEKPGSDIIGHSSPYGDSPMMSFVSGNGVPHFYDIQRQGTMLSSSHSTISFSNNNSSTIHLLNSQIPYGNTTTAEVNLHDGAPHHSSSSHKQTSMAAMREMIFRIAAMQPIYIDPEAVKPPKRRNVKISKDPQSVAARHRRERISERIRILQRLVPGGTKMDTASMLDEAIHYVKFLKTQVQSLERAAINNNRPLPVSTGLGFPVAVSTGGYYTGGASKGNYPVGGQANGVANQN